VVLFLPPFGELQKTLTARCIKSSNQNTSQIHPFGEQNQMFQNLPTGPQLLKSFIFYRKTPFIKYVKEIFQSGALLGVVLGKQFMMIS
jgi:hypothetical protein